jgi:hypothetical protein
MPERKRGVGKQDCDAKEGVGERGFCRWVCLKDIGKAGLATNLGKWVQLCGFRSFYSFSLSLLVATSDEG